MNFLTFAVLIGAGATAVMDLWAIARKRLLGMPPPDYGLVGRWLAYMARGRFRHDRIAASPPVRGERLIGWTAHYLIGIAFAAVLLAIWGLEWVAPSDARPGADRRHRHRGGAVPADAAGHGRRHRREPHAAPRRRPLAEPRHARDLRPRPLRGRLGYKLACREVLRRVSRMSSPRSSRSA